MKIQLNPTDFPILMKISPTILEKTILEITKRANPNLKEITQEDLLHTAKMMEMDLKAEQMQKEQTTDQDIILQNLSYLKKIQEEHSEWS